MAWGKPRRDGKCLLCGRGGKCSCQRAVNAELARNPAARPHPCGKCGRTVRGGICPGPDC